MVGKPIVPGSLAESRNQPLTRLGAQYATVHPKSKGLNSPTTFKQLKGKLCVGTVLIAPVNKTDWQLICHDQLTGSPSTVWEPLPFWLIDADPSYVTAHYATIKDQTSFEEISFITIIMCFYLDSEWLWYYPMCHLLSQHPTLINRSSSQLTLCICPLLPCGISRSPLMQ